MLYRLLCMKRPLMLVSDASVQKNGCSGFAWAIAAGPTPIWRSLGLAHSPSDDIHSGRGEAFGLLAAILFIRHYISYYPPLEFDTTMTCHCDNSGVITNLTNLQKKPKLWLNDTMHNDMDLYLEITANARANTRLLFRFIHVKGHQDTKPDHQLTTPEQHNVECDRCAKAHVQQQHPPAHRTTPQLSTLPAHISAFMAKSFVVNFYPLSNRMQQLLNTGNISKSALHRCMRTSPTSTGKPFRRHWTPFNEMINDA